ncbi:MAG: IPT/TIG domain-containing protein [Planctomycetes bacterium]|nr:IPT/TIG domain-containing protein [Planctomycetota bacterium]
MVRRYRCMLPCLLPVFLLLTTSLPAFTDPFDDDPTLAGSGWELYDPASRALYAHDPVAGLWRFTIPTGTPTLDHWTSVDRGVQLRRSDALLAGDFVIETRVNFVGSGDPSSPTWPPVAASYQAAIMVYFSQYNIFYWGFYGGTTLQLERSGAGGLCSVNPGLQEVSLQIKRIGSVYYFSYREFDTDPWILVCTQTYDVTTYPAAQVGLIFKSWASLTAQETFDFDYFTIDEPPPVTPVIQDVAPDPQAAFAEGPYELQMQLLDGYPVPTWSLVSAPATAMIDENSGAIAWVPAPGDVGLTFPFEVKAENTGGTATETFDVLVHPLATEDPFDEDPARPDSPWEVYDPVGALTAGIEDGAWRVVIPTGTNLDHWLSVDRGIQLRRGGLPEDFIVETRVNFLGSGASDPPAWPPLAENYNAILMVYFAPTDAFYWGLYMGTTLRLERSGVNNLCAVDPGLRELSLQIKKVGTLYSFSYRESDGDDWTLVCTQTVATVPKKAGLMFKTWGVLPTQIETFDFDYLTVKPVPPVAPEIDPPCFLDPDVAWIGMPYIRTLAVNGYPTPDVSVASGPAMTYDFATGRLTGWTPDAEETLAVKIDAKNAGGEASAEWEIQARTPYAAPDDDFDDDPRDDASGYWDFYEPLGGVQYSIVEDPDETTWWRLGVPTLGTGNLTFDHWSTVDRAVQLRHDLGGLEDFVVETRLRVDAATAPPLDDEFQVGLMLYFGQYDLLYFGAMEERTIGTQVCNIGVERSGIQNMFGASAPDLLAGTPVRIRIEKTCGLYNLFLLDEGAVDPTWVHIASYTTASPLLSVGLVMKTWGDGLAHLTNFDIDYFDVLYRDEPAPVFPAVASVEPSSGPIEGGTAVTITGENFAAGAGVRFGGEPATDVVVASATEITCTTPAHAAGAVEVEVRNPDGRAGTLAEAFTYEAGVSFIRGDTDGNGQYTIGDGVQILERIFANRAAFTSDCEDTGDLDDNGIFTIGDAVWLFNYLFAEGELKKPPYPPADTCGIDPTPETTLGCNQTPEACR